MDILANNFIEYKEGFMEAKNNIIKNYKLGNSYDNNDIKENSYKNEWHNYGYEDGIQYFTDLLYAKKLDLEGMHELEDLQECFTRRISRLNEETEENSFKIAI